MYRISFGPNSCFSKQRNKTQNGRACMKKLMLSTLFMMIAANSYAQKNVNTSTVTPHRVTEDSGYKPHLGLVAGTSTPEGSNKTGSEFAIDAGYQAYVPFSVGFEISRNSYENENTGMEYRDNLMAKAAYNFGGNIPVIKNSYIGVGAGISMIENVGHLVSSPLLGFDIPVTRAQENPLSLGALAKYLVYEGTNPDSLTVAAVVKYWY